METKKEETPEVVFFNLKISKKQLQRLAISLTFTAVAGAILFFVKHS